ncbi:MAG: aldo/keto reductase [Gemmatimonadetes bacterium]|nr:aldo/keto reductase [Gemmatimonadota bacterium]
MEKRPYGSSGDMLSIIGFGGIVVSQTEPDEASRLVAEAVDRGINYFDVAPTYGNAEERLGPALEPYRKDIFLACKTTQRSKQGAADELHSSLKQLRTDHFDVYQMHSLNTAEDFEQATGPNGALETFVEAREKGLVRHIGFSSHSVETALRLLDYYPFDSVLFPINWTEYLRAGFGPQVVAKAEEKGVTRLALKGMAFGKFPEGKEKVYKKCWYEPIDDMEMASLALRFTLSQPITAALPPGEAELFRMALEIGEKFTPITEEETEELRRRSAEAEPFFELEPAA